MSDAEATTRTERLAADIAERILTGELAPGERLDEMRLAERYGVSRTPVREALRQLGSSGLVEVRPRRGACVAAMSALQLAESFGAMAEMEATCARLSALCMSPLERRRLASLHDDMGEIAARGDGEAYAALNVAFHGAIYAGAHNAILADFALRLRRRVSPFRRAQFRTPGRLPRSHAEHDAVVKAILASDPAFAHAAMSHHVSLVEEAFEQLVQAKRDRA